MYRLFLFTFFLVFSFDVIANNVNAILEKADTYFDQGKYTEALDLYEQVFQTKQKYSSQMLLKMAFVYQGLGDYTKVLHVLSLYQNQTSDYETILEMEKIAENNDLKGYVHSDLDFIKMLFFKYFFVISIILIILFFTLLCFLIYRRMKGEAVLIRYKIVFILLLGLFFFMVQTVPNQRKQLIIAKDNTYLVSVPSAGGKVVDILNKGHRLDFLDKSDIWYKVKWEDKEGFIKKFNVFVVEN